MRTKAAKWPAASTTALRPYGITPAQLAALTILSDHDGITAAELARQCQVTPPRR
jgi:DNA-binding MarR family transcriptional regulator